MKLNILERIIIQQLESVGSFDEQNVQLDLRDSIKVDQAYLDSVEAKIGDEKATLEQILQGKSFTMSKDDFDLEMTDEQTKLFTKWVHLSCRRLPTPPSLLVQLYRRLNG